MFTILKVNAYVIFIFFGQNGYLYINVSNLLLCDLTAARTIQWDSTEYAHHSGAGNSAQVGGGGHNNLSGYICMEKN